MLNRRTTRMPGLGRATVAACLLLAFTLACDDDDPTGPTLESVAGAYAATEFMGGGFDVIALGGSLTMTLTADGTVTGQLSIPEAAGGPFDANLAGTYSLSGNAVTFDQAADTFIRDADWTWSNGVLDGEWEGDEGLVTVRMVRQ